MRGNIIWISVWLIVFASPAFAIDAGPRPSSSQPSSRPAEQPGDGGTAGATTGDAGASGDAQRKLPNWAPKVSATVKPAIALIGDPIEVTIKVRQQKGISVNLPLQLELGKFSEIDRSDSVKELSKQGPGKVVERTFVLKVASYELGEHTLPAIEITALGPGSELVTLKTMPIPIKIRGVLRNEPNAKLKSLAPPVEVFQRTWWLLYIIIAVAAIGVVVTATLLINRRLRARRERLKPPPPPVPAHEVAFERLYQIDLDQYLQKEQFKELYLSLSEIIREYVGRRWSFDSLELTTTELAESLRHCSLSKEEQSRFNDFFSACDLVKFAKYVPTVDVAKEAYESAEALIQETMYQPPPHSEPEDDSTGGPSPSGQEAEKTPSRQADKELSASAASVSSSPKSSSFSEEG